MSRGIMFKAWQNMVNFRKPTSFQIKESYPLPPYSSIIGMLHVLADFKDYHPMKVSVQGRTAGSISDVYTHYAFGISYDAERHQFYVEYDDKKDGINRGIKHVELIIDCEWLIHIQPEDESDNDKLIKALHMPPIYPSLGRHEDLLVFGDIQKIELIETDEFLLEYDAYIPMNIIKDNDLYDTVGTVYKVNKVFDRSNGYRRWKESVTVKHVGRGYKTVDLDTPIFKDQFENPVFFA